MAWTHGIDRANASQSGCTGCPISLILLSLYLYFYRHYAWVLLAAAIALLLINPLAARVFVVGWCVLTVAYLVGLGAYLLAVRVIQGH